MSLEIFDTEKQMNKKDSERIKKFLKEVMRTKGLLPKDYDISIVFVEDEKIRELNRKYRDRDRPTDVLSFNLGKDPRGRIIGEIYISIPTAEKQSKGENKSLIDELAFLSLHGVLHILGFDHETFSEREKMDKEIQSLLRFWV